MRYTASKISIRVRLGNHVPRANMVDLSHLAGSLLEYIYIVVGSEVLPKMLKIFKKKSALTKIALKNWFFKVRR